MRLEKRRESAAISHVSTTASSELGVKGANITILKFALNSRRVDREAKAAHMVGIARISIRKSAEVHCRGSPAIDLGVPAILSILGSKGMEMVVAESLQIRTIF